MADAMIINTKATEVWGKDILQQNERSLKPLLLPFTVKPVSNAQMRSIRIKIGDINSKLRYTDKDIGNNLHCDSNMLNCHYNSASNNASNSILTLADYEIIVASEPENLQAQKSRQNKNQDLQVSVCIVTPTYNEVHNIPKLLSLIYSKEQKLEYNKHNILMNVLVVDDNSPDGTADAVKSYQKGNPNIYLLLRKEKNGLGAAYIAGMQHAMKLLKPDIVFEMDADLSHSPKYILPMINKIRNGADFVVGSRYVKGGSIPKNWGIKRKLLSKSANLYAKTFLGIKDINDCTGGFRAIRSSALNKIDLGSLNAKGYIFQISLLEEMRRNNAVLKEVPISFKDRTSGESKMRLYDMVEGGFFVLNASLKNIFYNKKILLKSQNNPQNSSVWEQSENRTNSSEFHQSYSLTEESESFKSGAPNHKAENRGET